MTGSARTVRGKTVRSRTVRTENAILRNLLAETLRVYEEELGMPSAPPLPAEHRERRARARSTGLGFRVADLRTENSVLRSLLATTTEAYEDWLSKFRAEKELARHLLAGVSDAVVLLDASGKVTSLNPAAEALTGWASGEARGHALGEVVRLADAQGAAVALDLAPCLAAGRRVDLAPELRWTRPGGGARPVEGFAAPIRDRPKHVLGAVLVLRSKPEARASNPPAAGDR